MIVFFLANIFHFNTKLIMADFGRRKLLNESAVDPSVAQLCDTFCDTTKNPYGICPLVCIDLCESSCRIPIFPPPPKTDDLLSPSDPPDKTYRLSLFLTISLAILATFFLFFACYTIYKFCLNWYNLSRRPSQPRQPEDEESGPDDFLNVDHEPMVDHPIWYIRTVGLQPSVISAITIVKYKSGDGLIEGTECSVCLNEFQEDETLRLLPKCNHAFHIPCIDTWLRSHTNCPMCRAGIVNKAAVLPSQELIVQNSGLEVETNRVGVSDRNSEVGREPENDQGEGSELRIRIEDDSESRARDLIGSKINEIFRESEGNSGSDTIQPMRRSVSVDSLTASIISDAITKASGTQSDLNSNHQLAEMKESSVGIVAKRVGINQSLLRFIGTPSRSLQIGSSSINRSLSCSAKVFLSRYSNRSRNPVIPR